MKTIALRFGETFSPEYGTIAAHQQIINDLGYVWYGKMGSPVNNRIIVEILKLEDPKILLIQSGKFQRYWAHIIEIQKEAPELEGIPDYYRNNVEKFKTWFKVIAFEKAPKDIMSKCIVSSSKAPLGLASRHSMSPYFIIEYND